MRITIVKINVKIMKLSSGTFRKSISPKLEVYFPDFEKFMTVVFNFFASLTLRRQESCFTKEFAEKYSTKKWLSKDGKENKINSVVQSVFTKRNLIFFCV